MKKLLLFISVLLVILYSSSIFIYGMPNKVRVGLEYKYKNVNSVPISNKEISIGYEYNGNFIKSADIFSNNGFTAVVSNMAYIKIEGSYHDYALAKAATLKYSNMGVKAVVGFTDSNTFYVYLGGFDSQKDAMSVQNMYPNSTLLNANNRRVLITEQNNPILLFDNEVLFGQISGINQVPVALNDRKYRGIIEFSRFSGSGMTAVNIITLDDYLCSVVPSEMPSKWNLEALKAQAVACRSYAATRFGIHKELGYDLCDLVHCQAYVGAGNEAKTTDQAVYETSGIMAYYDNKPINAVYFSSSGGTTADSETVWANTIPYLRSVSDSNETTGKIWERVFTLNDMNSILLKNNVNIGNAVKVSINSISNSNRVNELIITGSNGQKSLSKEEIRNFFAPSVGGILESRNFVISGTNVNTEKAQTNQSFMVQGANMSGIYPFSVLYGLWEDGATSSLIQNISIVGANGTQNYNTQTGTINTTTESMGNTITFIGKGHGHGVGMSQHGANGMANAGYNFIEILKHYYSGIQVY